MIGENEIIFTNVELYEWLVFMCEKLSTQIYKKRQFEIKTWISKLLILGL